MYSYHNKYIVRFISVFISTFSIYIFIRNGHTAYEVPAVDNFHFIMRYFDSEFAINDFLTNAYSEFNPRHIFIYLIIYGSKLFHIHWYHFFFFLKIIVVILLPLVHFFIIYIFITKKSQTILSYYVFTFLNLIFICWLICRPNFLTIAGWSSMMMQVIPQTLSLILCLGSYCISNFTHKKKLLLYIIFFLGTVIHPAVGLFSAVIIFLLTCTNEKIALNQILIYFTISIISGLLINISFGSNSIISAEEFNFHYCEIGHPSHYLLKYFENFSVPWYYNFFVVIILLLLGIIFGYLKDKKLLRFSITSLFFYTGCLFLQHLTTVIYPIKIISTIGPVRFSMFSNILVSISSLWILSIFGKKLIYNFEKNYFFEFIKKLNLFSFYIIISSLIIFCQIKYIDDPFNFQDDEMLSWIVKNTDKNSVFISFNRDVDINLKAKRSLYITQAFPFNEKHFKEFSKKYISVYSKRSYVDNKEGFWSGEKHNRFYHSLSPEYFKKLANSNKINYLVFENKFLNKGFISLKPSFKNQNYSIYNISKL